MNWNGSQNEFFKPQRGIRQGDPMSPYLFVLFMDKLSHLIEEQVEAKRWKSLKLGQQGIMISHLIFTDDLLLFGEANERELS